MATSEQAAELRELVAIVAADWPDDDRAEALAVALADPEAALMSFRALAATATPATSATEGDDRRACEECTNLDRHRGRDGFRRCAAARRRELPDIASRDYSPVPDVPRRCESYMPGPDYDDQRPGRE